MARQFKIRFIKEIGKAKIGDIIEVPNPLPLVDSGDAEFIEQKDADYFNKQAEKEEIQKKKTFIKYDKIIQRMDKEEKDNRLFKSGFVDKEKKILVDQVWDKDNGSRFCIYNDNTKEIKYEPTYKDGDKVYYPQEGEELDKKAVILPSKAEEYVSDIELDNEILKFVDKWLDVPKYIRQLGLWFTKRSFVYDRFNTTPYLRIRGDLGLGKSRFLDVYSYIGYKTLVTTGSITPAPLFRLIDKWRGNLTMDEADLKKSDASDDVIKVLNEGFERGRFIWRCDTDDPNKVKPFDPFCPKIIATRLAFEDKATESRCLTHIASATKRSDIPIEKNESFYIDAEQIRNKLLMWRFKNYFNIKTDTTVDFGMLEPRVKQLVNGFASLFTTDEEEMKIFKDWIADYQEELILERQDSLSGEILSALHDLMEEGAMYISNQDIINKGNIIDFNNKPMNSRKLNGTLKSLGLGKSKVVRMNKFDTKRCIPLKISVINSLFKRYGFTEIEDVEKYKCYDVTDVTVPRVVSPLDEFDSENEQNKTLTKSFEESPV